MTDITVRADYHQYYVCDAESFWEYSPEADQANDGILSPTPTALRVSTGVQTGDVVLGVEVVETPTRPEGIAAACDLAVPSGVVEVRSWDSSTVGRYEFPGVARVRVVVTVAGRDHAGSDAPERHSVTLSPASADRPRWRSAADDETGPTLAPMRTQEASDWPG